VIAIAPTTVVADSHSDVEALKRVSRHCFLVRSAGKRADPISEADF
jgi:hypothetical protein